MKAFARSLLLCTLLAAPAWASPLVSPSTPEVAHAALPELPARPQTADVERAALALERAQKALADAGNATDAARERLDGAKAAEKAARREAKEAENRLEDTQDALAAAETAWRKRGAAVHAAKAALDKAIALKDTPEGQERIRNNLRAATALQNATAVAVAAAQSNVRIAEGDLREAQNRFEAAVAARERAEEGLASAKAREEQAEDAADERERDLRAAQKAFRTAEREAERARREAEAVLQEQARQAERARLAEEARIAKEKRAEEERLAEEARQAEKARREAEKAARKEAERREKERLEAQRAAERLRLAEEARIAKEKRAEEERIAEEARQAEKARREAEKAARKEAERREKERLEAQRAAERLRLAEEARVAKEKRAEEERIAEEARQAEKARREAEKAAQKEAERREKERLEAQRAAERLRLAEEARIAREKRAEEERIAEEARQAEKARREAEKAAQKEAERREKERLKAQRAAERLRLAEEARIAKEKRAEEERIAEEARQAEMARLAAERAAEKARLAEESRLAEEARQAEKLRLAEEKRLAQEAEAAEKARIAKEKAAERARLAEEERLAEEARQAEKARLAEERAAEKARLAEEREAEKARIAAEKEAERARLAEEKRLAQEAEEAERARLAEEARLEREKRAEEERIAKEAEKAEKLRLAEERAAEKARLAEEREAEKARIAAEREAERARIAEEKRLAQEAEEAERARLEALKAAEEARLAEEVATPRHVNVWLPGAADGIELTVPLPVVTLKGAFGTISLSPKNLFELARNGDGTFTVFTTACDVLTGKLADAPGIALDEGHSTRLDKVEKITVFDTPQILVLESCEGFDGGPRSVSWRLTSGDILRGFWVRDGDGNGRAAAPAALLFAPRAQAAADDDFPRPGADGRWTGKSYTVRLRANGALVAIPAAKLEAVTDRRLPPALVPASPSAWRSDEVFCPGGRFRIGRDGGEGNADETPAADIELAPFLLASTPVTKAQFRAFVQDARYVTTAERIPGQPTWKAPGFPQGDDEPVVAVTWRDAAAYCNWRSRKARLKPAYDIREEGRRVVFDPAADGYRLPLEAEWEWAARSAGTSVLFPWGGDGDAADEAAAVGLANFMPVALALDPWPKTNPVKAFPPTGRGFYDLAGNVWEWMGDVYAEDAYRTAYRTGDIASLLNPPEGATRVRRSMRGGSYANPLPYLRCTARGYGYEQMAAPRVGFRVARKAPADFR